jgi:ATP/ADP translocase
MTREELRALPQQTALVEHLIRHADAIGSMTSQVHQQTVEMTEELLRKKLNKKKRKKKGRILVGLSQQYVQQSSQLSHLVEVLTAYGFCTAIFLNR